MAAVPAQLRPESANHPQKVRPPKHFPVDTIHANPLLKHSGIPLSDAPNLAHRLQFPLGIEDLVDSETEPKQVGWDARYSSKPESYYKVGRAEEYPEKGNGWVPEFYEKFSLFRPQLCACVTAADPKLNVGVQVGKKSGNQSKAPGALRLRPLKANRIHAAPEVSCSRVNCSKRRGGCAVLETCIPSAVCSHEGYWPSRCYL